MGKQGRTITQRASGKPQALAKIPTRITGLDDILEGGFPAGRTTPITDGAKLSEVHGLFSTAQSHAETRAAPGGEP